MGRRRDDFDLLNRNAESRLYRSVFAFSRCRAHYPHRALRLGLPFVPAGDAKVAPLTKGRIVVEASTRRGRGTGWIVFAGILMILAGANMAMNGLWALHAPDAVVKSFSDSKVLLFSSGDLDTWGWIYLIVGAVVIVAGIMVFFRVAFGIWVGIAAAVVQAFFAFFWIFSPYWPAALVIIALDLLVIYALSSSPDDREYYA
jgi:hypothetical protein